MQKERVSFLQDLKSSLGFLFSINDIDDHFVIKFFGIKFCKKHEVNFEFKEVTESGVTKEKRTPKLIVSLTTFPARINIVYKTISTLLQQTVKPDEIVLWLADEQFPDRKLPENLTRLQEYGLSIKWCEDIKSFKKLIPSLREYPDDIIVTADDDIFYPKNYVESLYNQYLKNPHLIHTNRAFTVRRKNDKFFIKARNYEYNSTYLPAFTNEFMTGYGTLFPPKSLHEDVMNKNVFMDIIPTNDDCWFWGMAVKNGIKINVNPNGYELKLLIDRTVQDSALWKLNMRNSTIGLNGNDAVTMLCDLHPEIKKNVLSEYKG